MGFQNFVVSNKIHAFLLKKNIFTHAIAFFYAASGYHKSSDIRI